MTIKHKYAIVLFTKKWLFTQMQPKIVKTQSKLYSQFLDFYIFCLQEVINMNFSDKLKKHRKELGLSQEELSYELNVSRQAVSKWENDQGYPETEKLLLLSNLFSVSLDYLLKEEPNSSYEENEKGYYANKETVYSFLEAKKRHSKKIALGVVTIIFSTVFPLFFSDGVGTTLFLCGVALGVGILVLSGFAPKQYAELDEQPLVFDPAFLREFKLIAQQRRKRYGLQIVFGIVLIIISVAAVSAIEDVFFIKEDNFTALVPIAVSIAVYIFIISNSALEAEKIIAMNEEYLKEKNDPNDWIFGCGMTLAAMVFVALGLSKNLWHIAWVIFPVTAVICTIIAKIRNPK